MNKQIIDEVDVSKCMLYRGGWCGKSGFSTCAGSRCEYKFCILIQKVQILRAKNSFLKVHNQCLREKLGENANKVMEDFIGKVINAKET